MTTLGFAPPLTRWPKPPAAPPLQNGDNLTDEEFERRYDAIPPGTRAELIEGIVHMAAALSHGFHGEQHFDLIGLLSVYRRATPGVVGGDNGICRLDLGNLPQPDIYLMVAPGLGGTATVGDDGYVAGPPELVIEVSNTSADHDLHQKREVYRRNGVPEYAVWRTMDAEFDYFVLDAGVYRRAPAGPDGLIRSGVLPGLWLNVTALLHGDLTAVEADVRRGLASPEHAAFVADLARRRAASPVDRPSSS